MTQKSVGESLRRADGRRVLPPFLNDLERDRRYSPKNTIIEQLANLLGISADVLYFYAQRIPEDIDRQRGKIEIQDSQIDAAYRAFRETPQSASKKNKRISSPMTAK